MSSTPPPPPPSDPGDQQPQEPQGQPPQSFPQPPPEQAYSQQPYAGQSQQPYPQQPYPGQQLPPQYGGPGVPYSGQVAGQLSPSEERTWSILAHLSAPIAFVLSSGLLNFVGPLIIWAIYKDRSHMVRNASAGSFNFNLSIWVVNIAFGLFALITLGFGLIIAIPVWITTFVIAAVLHIMAAIKAGNGQVYTYPFQLPVLK